LVITTLTVVSSPAYATTTRYEAEDATLFKASLESLHGPFSGRGYVNYDNEPGGYIQWTIKAPAAGSANVVFRFAQNAGVDRPMDIAVNGVVTTPSMSFPDTGAWAAWQTKSIVVPVTAGTNTIRATAIGSTGGPNVDWLELTMVASGTVFQAEDATLVHGIVDTAWSGWTGRGFANMDRVIGSSIEWSVPAARAGNASLAIRYAQTGDIDRPMDITVNGTLVRVALGFPDTGAWTTWRETTFTVGLSAGVNHIRATALISSGGPNVDLLSVSQDGDLIPPTAPGQPSCSAITTTGLTLTWPASTDNVGVVGYDIYHDGTPIGATTGATTTALTGLSANTQYRLSVLAHDAAGNMSTASPRATCTTLPSADTQPPTAPGNLTTSGVTGSSVNLAWTAATDNAGVTRYQVRSGATVLSTVGNVTSTTLTGLACSTTYSLTVVALDAAGNVSGPSNERSVTTLACSGGFPSNITTISTGWTIPWGTAWLPDGQTALITERDSFQVFKVNLAGVRTSLGTVPNTVTTGGEGGLLGVAVDPQWTTNHYVYFMHSAAEGNRIARMTYNGATLSGYTAILTGITKNTIHNGGRIGFGPDGFLYATTGDAGNANLAQDITSLNGKILRLRTDGAAAPGNPFTSRIYSYGHRNPQGLAWDSQGRLWSAELGNNVFDELNLIKPGRNYGWPICEGTCSVSGMENPKRQWPTTVASPSGIAIVRDVVYMATLRGSRMWRIPLLDGENTGIPTEYYVGQYGRLRTITKVPGSDQLWLSTTNADANGGQPSGVDRIFRITIS
jgi:glucose/arabinose dehydrogenase